MDRSASIASLDDGKLLSAERNSLAAAQIDKTSIVNDSIRIFSRTKLIQNLRIAVHHVRQGMRRPALEEDLTSGGSWPWRHANDGAVFTRDPPRARTELAECIVFGCDP